MGKQIVRKRLRACKIECKMKNSNERIFLVKWIKLFIMRLKKS